MYIDDKDTTSLVCDNDSGLVKVGFAGESVEFPGHQGGGSQRPYFEKYLEELYHKQCVLFLRV